MNLPAIRSALAQLAATVPGVTGYATVPALPSTPAVVVELEYLLPHSTFSHGDDVYLKAAVLVSIGEVASAQDQLDGYLADGGLIDAIETDFRFQVERVDGYGQVTQGEVSYGTVVLHVHVLEDE